MVKDILDAVKWFLERLTPPVAGFARRPRLKVSLKDTGRDGVARAKAGTWGNPGPPSYIVHVVVQNTGATPARDVYLYLRTIKKLDRNGTFQNTLTTKALLRNVQDPDQQPAPVDIGPQDEGTWNLCYIHKNLGSVWIDVHEQRRPPNYQGFLLPKEVVRAEAVSFASNARAATLGIEIEWDGKFIENNPEAMAGHLKVRTFDE